MKNKIDYLEKEYCRVTETINSFTNRQINYMNYTLILFSGAFIYLIQKENLSGFKPYFPYSLFLVYGQFVLEIYRTLVLQFYRKFLAKKINELANEKIIYIPLIYSNLIINFKSNIFYLMYTLFWISILFAFLIFCHSGSQFKNPNFIIQLITIIIFIMLYFRKIKKTRTIDFDALTEE